MTDITRKKDTGETGNGGQFGSKTNSDPETELKPKIEADRIGDRLDAAVETNRPSDERRQTVLQRIRPGTTRSGFGPFAPR